MDQILQKAIRIALLAGEKIKALRESDLLTEDLKYGYELVTNADILSNELIKKEIWECFPAHEILSEEDTTQHIYTCERPTWIIDPIDGTVNYANGHHQVAISIAYATAYKVQVGVVYNPFLDELFYAVEGLGAFLNGQKIHVKDVAVLETALVATGFPYTKNDVWEIMSGLERVWPRVRDLRRLGSAALDICWVACGRIQGYYEATLQPWDVAAAKLIAQEAGAATGYFKDDSVESIPDCIRSNNLIVSSPKIFDALKTLLV